MTTTTRKTKVYDNEIPIVIIVAVDQKNGIGNRKLNTIPWHSKHDMAWFKTTTTTVKDPSKRNAIVMGYRTFLSMNKKHLPERENFVIDKNVTSYYKTIDSLRQEKDSNIETIFVIGGASIYEEALLDWRCSKLYITNILGDFKCDVFFPDHIGLTVNERWILSTVKDLAKDILVQEYNRPTTEFWVNKTQNPEENAYINLVRQIINRGRFKPDRTGVGTKQLVGCTLRFNLSNMTMPLFTTKKMAWRWIVEELRWFIKGSTDTKELSDLGVHIWDANSSRSFLDKVGLKKNEVGDVGPAYGFQWRHWGATYFNCHTDYKGTGFDQLQQCINDIITVPSSRRILMYAWNPDQTKQMALPPCHVLYQFFVNEDTKTLTCLLYQRSADVALGVPFNIASASLLTHIIAHICGLKAEELVWMAGDTHIYKNHIETLQKLQLTRTGFGFPHISFRRPLANIDDFITDDVILHNYHHQGDVRMEMAV